MVRESQDPMVRRVPKSPRDPMVPHGSGNQGTQMPAALVSYSIRIKESLSFSLKAGRSIVMAPVLSNYGPGACGACGNGGGGAISRRRSEMAWYASYGTICKKVKKKMRLRSLSEATKWATKWRPLSGPH